MPCLQGNENRVWRLSILSFEVPLALVYMCTQACLACRVHKQQQNDGQTFLNLLLVVVPAISAQCFSKPVELLASMRLEWFGPSSLINRSILYLNKVAPVNLDFKNLWGGKEQVLKQNMWRESFAEDSSFCFVVRQVPFRAVQQNLCRGKGDLWGRAVTKQ